MDRAAVREAACELDWHDEDIVSQIGEGGVEARSGCELTTVLAFHHQGLGAAPLYLLFFVSSRSLLLSYLGIGTTAGLVAPPASGD